MTSGLPDDTSSIWRVRLLLSRLALVSAASLLVAGLALAMAGQSASVGVLRAAFLLLVCIPILNVSAVFAVELRTRDWRFAAAAGAVLLLLAFTLVRRLL